MRRSRSLLSFALVAGVLALVAVGATSALAHSGSKAVAAPKGDIVRGEVGAVNAEGKVLTIKAKKGEVQVTWTETTKVAWKSGKEKPEPATAADLKVGEHVSVRGDKTGEGAFTANSIWIQKPGVRHAKGKSGQ